MAQMRNQEMQGFVPAVTSQVTCGNYFTSGLATKGTGQSPRRALGSQPEHRKLEAWLPEHPLITLPPCNPCPFFRLQPNWDPVQGLLHFRNSPDHKAVCPWRIQAPMAQRARHLSRRSCLPRCGAASTRGSFT